MTAISAAALPPDLRIDLVRLRKRSLWVYARCLHGTWSLTYILYPPGSGNFAGKQLFLLNRGYKLVIGTGEPIARNGKESA